MLIAPVPGGVSAGNYSFTDPKRRFSIATEFSGKVLFANGVPAPGVEVRVWDKDVPDEEDVTVSPGLSDARGDFTVRFSLSRRRDSHTAEPARAGLLSWASLLRRRRTPDLQFRYRFRGQSRAHTISLSSSAREFRLPEILIPAQPFKPSLHGFKFANSFPGYPLPFSLPYLPGLAEVSKIYGLCGGMTSAVYDFFLAGRPISPRKEIPSKRTKLYKYLYKRQLDTFGAFGKYIARFVKWMSAPDDTLHGTWKRTYDEFTRIRSTLDDENPVLLGLVYVSWRDTLALWQNHQVMAYGYTKVSDTVFHIHIYDPNFPEQDQMVIRAEKVAVAGGLAQGLKCTHQQLDGAFSKNVRGFFTMPYAPVPPP